MERDLGLSSSQPSIKAHRVDTVFGPPGRQGFGSVVVGSDLYVFGGRLNDQSQMRIYSNDLLKLSMPSKEWTEVIGAQKEVAVTRRHNCSLAVRPSLSKTFYV